MCYFKTDPQDLCSLLQTWAIHVKFNFKNTIFEKSRPILTACSFGFAHRIAQSAVIF